MTKNNELKPCPFCGKLEVFLGEPKNEDEYGVMCNSCGAEGGLDEDGEFAISLWNARPIEDALRVRIAELEASLSEWYMAWITDSIGPTSNGVTCLGLDEGMVVSVRMMRPILDKTRELLPDVDQYDLLIPDEEVDR